MIRVVVALVLTGQVTGALAVILGIAAVMLLAIGAIGFCALYTVLGFSTCPRKTA